jgi:hypothetical protein
MLSSDAYITPNINIKTKEVETEEIHDEFTFG